ncbi:hypothetical protein EIP91_009378 [Steccherinum ochraceum]|uniref:NAD(P)-binding domain-containing protein n=1 Tax=Steccherinum ochraceum TaxID=92696 RepID=A0A4R0R1Q3_9APHY|nr:hypothetical protein EIP91_009378 [Steccherinum ochraceum]
MSNPVKILVIGATGYLGGIIVDRLLTHPQASRFAITAFARSDEKAKKIEAAGLGLKATSGDLSALTEATAKSDVVFNVASSDNLPLVQAILDGAKKHFAATKVPVVLIHTSGSAIVADQAMGEYASDKVYDDSDSAYLDAIPVQQWHRNVDIPIAAAHNEGEFVASDVSLPKVLIDFGMLQGYIKAYVTAPPMIWGLATGKLVDAGLQNPVQTGLLVIGRFSVLRGQYGRFGPQKNLWSTIEVHDLADLHVALFNQAVLEGKKIAGGSAYYFSANGDVATADWAPLVAKALHKYGALKSAEITPFSAEELKKWPVLGAFSVNSRCSDSRSRSLGWKPRPDKTGKEYLQSIDENIKLMVQQPNDFGASWGSFQLPA